MNLFAIKPFLRSLRIQKVIIASFNTNVSGNQTTTRVSKLPKVFNTIKTLLATDKWRETIKIIEENRIKCTQKTLPVFSCLAANAFYDEDETLGWKILNEINAANQHPDYIAFQGYWKYCASRNKAEFIEFLEKMLKYIGQNEILVSRQVIDALNDEIKRIGGAVIETKVNYTGECESCHKTLDSIQLSALEFKKLKTQFEKLFVKNNMNLSELGIFKQLVNSKKTYDFIIDALNVTRIFPDSQGNIYRQSKLLAEMVEHLRRQNKRVFIIGKKHIEEWPEPSLNYIRRNASVFLTNYANDDTYMMYAALISGSKTDFISNDFFSEYRSQFEPIERRLFRQWQKQHQHLVSYDFRLDTFKIHKPKLYNCNAHKNLDGLWHIPFVTASSNLNKSNIRPLWGCIQLKGL